MFRKIIGAHKDKILEASGNKKACTRLRYPGITEVQNCRRPCQRETACGIRLGRFCRA